MGHLLDAGGLGQLGQVSSRRAELGRQRSSAFKFMDLHLDTGLPEYKNRFQSVEQCNYYQVGLSLPAGRRQRRDPYRKSLGRSTPTDYNREAHCVMSKARGGILQIVV